MLNAPPFADIAVLPRATQIRAKHRAKERQPVHLYLRTSASDHDTRQDFALRLASPRLATLQRISVIPDVLPEHTKGTGWGETEKG